MSYQKYLNVTMKDIATMIYNGTQNPNEKMCNQILDSLINMIRDYNLASCDTVNFTDHRKVTSK